MHEVSQEVLREASLQSQDLDAARENAQTALSEVYSKSEVSSAPEKKNVVAQQAQFVKTGELLQLEVVKNDDGTVLHGHELSTGERYTILLDADLVSELDPEDPWTELFTVIGISLGPPKELVLPTLVGRREVPLAPSGVWMILTVYKYDAHRYFLNGFDPQSQRLVDLVVMEDALTEEARQLIASITDDQVLFDFFLGRLHLFEQEGEEESKLRLIFNANVQQ